MNKLDIRNIKNELKVGYISSRYFDIDNWCINIRYNTYRNKVEIRIFNEEILEESFLYFDKNVFLKMTKKKLIEEIVKQIEVIA